MKFKSKLFCHLFVLPRWFAIPFFSASLLTGVILAGGSLASFTTWLAFLIGILLMAAGHSANSYLDYAWTGLDKGTEEERSAEKKYTGGQNLLAKGLVSLREVWINSLSWYIIAVGLSIYLATKTSWTVVPLVVIGGLVVPIWYSFGKFNFTHELSLGIGVGPLSVLLGMFGVNPHPNWLIGILISAPFAIILSFAGLALDEYPDFEANLKKGVKSLAYRVHKTNVGLFSYMMVWILFMYMYQFLTIYMGWLKPMTALSFITFPFILGSIMLCHENFEKYAPMVVIWAALYPILIFVGQVMG